MGLLFTVEVSPSHNLIGNRMSRGADGSLRLVPTRHDFWQRISGAVLLSGLGGALLGFMLFLELRPGAPSPPSKDAVLALRGLEVMGGLIILWGALSVLSWFRKRLTMWVDERGNLVFASRVWISRRETFPLSSVQSIQYGVRREAIGGVPVHEVNSNKPVAIVWIWSVTLAMQSKASGGKPRLTRFDVAAQEEAPPDSGRLPEEVIALCTWLRDTTGKPVTAMETPGD
jgi:hypothetical protein